MNYAVLILGNGPDTPYFQEALLAGFDIIGSFPSHGPGPFGSPYPSVIVVMRKDLGNGQVGHQTAGIWDYRSKSPLSPPPKEWFE